MASRSLVVIPIYANSWQEWFLPLIETPILEVVKPHSKPSLGL